MTRIISHAILFLGGFMLKQILFVSSVLTLGIFLIMQKSVKIVEIRQTNLGDVLKNYQTIKLYGTIDENLANQVVEELIVAKKMEKDVILEISSPGGSVLDGNKIITHMENLGFNNVITYCIDVCASMAAHIFITGKERVMANNAVLMFHPMSLRYSGPLGDLESMLKFISIIDQQLTNKLLSLVPVEHHNRVLPSKTQEVWILADEALSLNLATKMGIIY